jgi:predicted transcriptional regulator
MSKTKRPGRVALMSWISKKAAARLAELASERGWSKTAMLEHLILQTETDRTLLRGMKFNAAGELGYPEDEEDDEPIPEPKRHRRPNAVHVSLDGSPATLAQRVLESGRRRDAIVLRTGERASAERRRSR